MHESKREQEAVPFKVLKKRQVSYENILSEKRNPVPDEPLDSGGRSLWGVEKRLRILEISAERKNEGKTGDSFVILRI